MQDQDVLAPILSEQSLLMLGGGILVLLVVAGICFTIILYKEPSAIRSFRGGRVLHHVTVMTVVFTTVVLGLERILTGEAVASILGGIIGYVLGTLQREYPKSSDDETAANIR